MSIASEVKVQSLEARVERLEGTIQALLTRTGDLESELEAVKCAPAIASDIPSRSNAATKKR